MCIFCQIVKGEHDARIINEDDKHIAFLTPFPNTNGFTVVATKIHYESYVFDLPNDIYHELLDFSKMTGKLLDRVLNVTRTGLIMEGMGINHVHTKLVPLHGIEKLNWKPVLSTKRDFYEQYEGFIASHDGPPQSDKELDLIYNKFQKLPK